MKKLLIVMLSFGLVIGASAQRGYSHSAPTVRVGIGVGTTYGPGRYDVQRRINEINREYDNRIWAVEHDRRLSRREKKRAIHNLNNQRQLEIRRVRRW